MPWSGPTRCLDKPRQRMAEPHARLLADVIALGSALTPWSSPAAMPSGRTAWSIAPARTSMAPSRIPRPRPTSQQRCAPAWRLRPAGARAGDRPAVRPLHRDRSRTGMQGPPSQGKAPVTGRPEPVQTRSRRRGRDRNQGSRPRRPRAAREFGRRHARGRSRATTDRQTSPEPSGPRRRRRHRQPRRRHHHRSTHLGRVRWVA